MGTKTKQLGADDDDILFDTKMPIEEVNAQKAEMSLDEFDKLLNDEKNTFQ